MQRAFDVVSSRIRNQMVCAYCCSHLEDTNLCTCRVEIAIKCQEGEDVVRLNSELQVAPMLCRELLGSVT